MQTTAYEEYQSGGVRQTRLASGQAFVPDPLPPARIDAAAVLFAVREAYDEALLALGDLRGLAHDVTVARLLAAPLMRREARVSSKIEDTIATAEEVARYEAGERPTKPDTIEVANYRRALWHGIESDLPLCVRLVNDMHRILLSGARGDEQRTGEIRSIQNRIGGSKDDFSSARFVPPPPGESLTTCLRALERCWNEPLRPWPALIAIAMMHYQFEAIHPYGDGNGRLGRVLIVLSLLRSGLLPQPLVYISASFERRRREYADCLLRVSTDGAWEQWIEFFLVAVAEQARDASIRLTRIKDARDRIRQNLLSNRAPSGTLHLVDLFVEHLAIDVGTAERLLDVSNPTARGYIQRLESLGFLRELTGARYGQIWGAGPVLDVIDED
ncbi:MAG: Fic/DOC family N-terminal domain-containing protein [Planctomycetota bacterium]